MGWTEKELAELQKLRDAEKPQPSGQLVEVLITKLVGYKRGEQAVLSHLTEAQVACLVESGAVRPIEQPVKAATKKGVSNG